MEYESFNCGKMKHIFAVDKNYFYVPSFSCEEAKEAILGNEYTVYEKVDGSCGALIKNENDQFVIYSRHDAKNKFKNGIPDGYIPIPQGRNAKEFNDHDYYLKEMKRGDKIADSLYSVIIDFKSDKKFISAELVGKNFNRTPNVVGNNIAIHEDQEVKLDREFSSADDAFSYFKESLKDGFVEGYVIKSNGFYWKIRADCFNKKVPKNFKAPVLINKN